MPEGSIIGCMAKSIIQNMIPFPLKVIPLQIPHASGVYIWFKIDLHESGNFIISWCWDCHLIGHLWLSKSSCPVYFLQQLHYIFTGNDVGLASTIVYLLQFYNIPIFVQYNKITIRYWGLWNIYHLIKDSNNLVMLASHVVHWSSPFQWPGSAIKNYISSISNQICTQFCCALFCCFVLIVFSGVTHVFTHIHQGCLTDIGIILCASKSQWNNHDW